MAWINFRIEHWFWIISSFLVSKLEDMILANTANESTQFRLDSSVELILKLIIRYFEPMQLQRNYSKFFQLIKKTSNWFFNLKPYNFDIDRLFVCRESKTHCRISWRVVLRRVWYRSNKDRPSAFFETSIFCENLKYNLFIV